MPEITEEQRARATGWTPKEDFKGNPEKWTEAEVWNAKADELMPILRSNNKHLVTELGSTKSELAALRKTMNQIVKANDNVAEDAYKRALADIRNQQATAIENQDPEAWKKLDEAKEALTKPAKTEIPADDTLFKENEAIFFRNTSSWYGTDVEMTAFAKQAGNMYADQGISPTDQFEMVEAAVREKFPEKFNGTKHAAVGAPSGPGPKDKGKKNDFTSLPKEAQDAHNRTLESIVRRAPNTDKKEFTKNWLSNYHEEG